MSTCRASTSPGVVNEVGQGVSTGVAVGDRVMGRAIPSRTHGADPEDIVGGRLRGAGRARWRE